MNFYRTNKKFYFISGCIGFLLGLFYLTRGILASTNSTASIGFLFLPLFGFLGALLGITFSFTILNLKRILSGQQSIVHKYSAAALTILFGLLLIGWFWWNDSKDLSLVGSTSASAVEIQEIYQKSHLLYSNKIQQAIASNKNTPLKILTELSQSTDSYIISLLGANPSTPTEIINSIAEGEPDFTKMSGIASNPLLSENSIKKLISNSREHFKSDTEYDLYQTFVLSKLVSHPRLSQEDFDKIANISKSEYFLATAIVTSNRSNCDQIKKFTDNKSEVLKNTALNELSKRGCSL